MHRPLRILSLSLVLWLSACASNVSSNFKFNPNPTTGLVVGSISYESANAVFTLFARNTTTGDVVKFAAGCDAPCLFKSADGRFTDAQAPGQRGDGYAVEVPSGDYVITGWHVPRGGLRYNAARSPDIPFKVEAGKVTYLGNLHFDPHWEDVQLRDRSSRDLAALRTTYPVLASTPLAYSIAEGAVIHGVGGGYKTRMTAPTIYYVPVR